jgi:pre-mRNA-splicing factor CWC26
VGVIDERAADVIMKQEYIESGKWKAMKNDKIESSKKHKKNTSPQRRKSIDQSPPRKNRRNSDESPPRRNRKDSDASSPRKLRRDSDASPPRRNRKDSDESPPRKLKPRRDSDASPPRKPRQSSPMAKKRRDSDASPPRRSRNDSPKRSRNNSPLRNSRHSPQNYKKSRWENFKQEKSPSPPPTHSKKITKTLDGKAAGLQNAQTLKRENDEHRARQEKAFREMRADVSGRDAEVVIRDRRGRNKEFEYDAEKERKKMEAEEARKKEYEKWGKGLKQYEEQQKRRAEYEHEASKPLARAADDEDLQKHLKDQEWLDDPMLQYMRKKKVEDKRSKGILEKPKYKGNFPDNRFNIPPGYRWDGVNRSNGYENKYFMMINSKKSIEEEAYRYSTEDM